MTKITSHKDFYQPLASEFYLTPEQVESFPEPRTAEEHAIYLTADCLISERHEKGDLVQLVYALFMTERSKYGKGSKRKKK